MDPTPIDDDSLRKFERRALRNASALAHRLGLQDAFDRRRDNVFALAVGALVVTVIAALAISAARAPSEAELLRLARCERQFRVDQVWQLQNELLAAKPRLTAAEMTRLLEQRDRDAKPIAAIECAGGYSKR